MFDEFGDEGVSAIYIIKIDLLCYDEFPTDTSNVSAKRHDDFTLLV